MEGQEVGYALAPASPDRFLYRAVGDLAEILFRLALGAASRFRFGLRFRFGFLFHAPSVPRTGAGFKPQEFQTVPLPWRATP